MMRLQKYLARSGVASRRNSEKIIAEGRVTVNGHVVSELGTSVDENVDVVAVDGEVVKIAAEKVVLALNKPCGFVTTMDDPQGRPTVKDLISKSEHIGLFPVGRLDFDTSGLLLVTNDGELGAKLMHPSSEVRKTYVATVQGNVLSCDLDVLRRGVDLGDFITSPASCKLLSSDEDESVVEITIHEGKNRQVRRMFSAVNHPVVSLKRTKYANISIDSVKAGQMREVKGKELEILRSFV